MATPKIDYRTKWGNEMDYVTPTGIHTKLYNIGTLADELGRTTQAIRKWEISGVLPESPFRVNGRRMYSAEHIEAIVRCAETSHIKQGSLISDTAFPQKVLREFQRIHREFFGEEK